MIGKQDLIFCFLETNLFSIYLLIDNQTNLSISFKRHRKSNVPKTLFCMVNKDIILYIKR